MSAFAAAASHATPRAVALLQEDPTTQNVLATFLGAFLFSLVGLIAVRTDFYDQSAQVFLFLATVVVVALVVAALPRSFVHRAARLLWIRGSTPGEVQMRLHKALDALDRIAPEAFGRAASDLSAYALQCAAAAGMAPADIGALRAVAVQPRQTHGAGPVHQPPPS